MSTARRLWLNRDLTPDQVSAATEEAALGPGVPTDESTAGQMVCGLGGNPSVARDFDVLLVKPGGIGVAEWGMCEDPAASTTCVGINGRAVISDGGELDSDTAYQMPPALVRDRRNKKAYAVYRASTGFTGVRMNQYDKATKAWGASKDTDATPATAPVAACYFEDTGEFVIIHNGVCYLSGNPEETTPVFSEMGTIDGTWGTDRTYVHLVAARGRLYCFWIEAYDVWSSYSTDRGGSWSTPEEVIDAPDLARYVRMSVSVCPADGQIYIALNRYLYIDTKTYVDIVRGPGGTSWESVSEDFCGWGATVTATTGIGLAFEENSTLVLASVKADSIEVFTSSDFGVSVSGSNVMWTQSDASNEFKSCVFVDMGDELLALITMWDDTASAYSLMWASCRQWSSLCCAADSDIDGWMTNTVLTPDEFGMALTLSGSATATAGASALTLAQPDITADEIYYGSSYSGELRMARFRMKADTGLGYATHTQAVRLAEIGAAGHGFDFSIYLGNDGLELYDENASSAIETFVHDFSHAEHEFIVFVVWGGATHSVYVWYRETTGYPWNLWALALGPETISDDEPASEFAGFGTFIAASGSGASSSTWVYFFPYSEGNTFAATYANTTTDPSDLTGKRCRSATQEAYDDLLIRWTGSGGRVADRWSVATEYGHNRGNVFRPQLDRQWRSTQDELEMVLTFDAGADRRFRPEWLALLGKNFDEFSVRGYQEVTTQEAYGALFDNGADNDDMIDTIPGARAEPSDAPELTWSFWIRPDSIAGGLNNLVYMNYWSSTENSMFYLEPDGADTYLSVDFCNSPSGSCTSRLLFSALNGLIFGEWCHVVIQYDGGAASLATGVKVWTNGVEQTWTDQTGTLPATHTTQGSYHHIGGKNVAIAGLCGMNGVIGEFRMYDSAVGATVAEDTYMGGGGLPTHYTHADMWCEFLFNPQVANVVTDTSDNGTDCSTSKSATTEWWSDSRTGEGWIVLAVVGDGTSAADSAIAHECAYMRVVAVAEDWIEVNATDADQAGMWAGRFDAEQARGRRYFVRVLDGTAVGEVYKVEAVRRVGGTSTWSIKLARDSAGDAVTAETDGVAAADRIGIFGENFALRLVDEDDSQLTGGWRYLRLTIPSQKTWDGDVRLGFVTFAPTVELDKGKETGQPSHGYEVQVADRVAASEMPSGVKFRDRLGRAGREVRLAWTATNGRELMASPISALLEAAGEDAVVAYVDLEHLHTGPVTPTDPHECCYDPIVGWLRGPFTISHQASPAFNSLNLGLNLRGALVSLGGATIEEML